MSELDECEAVESGSYAIKARLDQVEPLLRRLQLHFMCMGLRDEVWKELEHSLLEGLQQAIEHANTKSGQAQRVELKWKWHGAGLEFRISEGENREKGEEGLVIRKTVDEVKPFTKDAEHVVVMKKTLENHSEEVAQLQDKLEALCAELSHTYEMAHAMFEWGEGLAQGMRADHFTASALDQMLSLSGASYGHVRCYDESSQALVLVQQAGESEVPLIDKLGIHVDCVEVHSWRSKAQFWREPWERFSLDDPLRSLRMQCLVTEIAYQGNALGVLVLANEPSKPALNAGCFRLAKLYAELLGMGWSLEKLTEERELRRAMLKEMEIASQMQNALLPSSFPQSEKFTVYGRCIPAEQVGGDYFDVLESEQGILLFIADVMGKGLPASVVATMLHTSVHALSDCWHQPDQLVKRLNQTLWQDLNRLHVYITVQAVFVSKESSTACVTLAGHCPLLLLRQDQCEELGEYGTPLGLEQEVECTVISKILKKGDRLLLVTDGMYETRNPREEFKDWDFDSLKRRACNYASIPVENAVEHLLEDVKALCVKASDDRTLILWEKTA